MKAHSFAFFLLRICTRKHTHNYAHVHMHVHTQRESKMSQSQSLFSSFCDHK